MVTSSAYPTMDQIKFAVPLKTRVSGVTVQQAYERGSYAPAVGPVYVSWVEINGEIVISGITGLVASKVYILRMLVI